ncbi:MAG: hypothetical protein OXU64_08265 [Gemmatimonadota bacterium]|nr:hypothetical protein [Gemmatimonadota bacterium]
MAARTRTSIALFAAVVAAAPGPAAGQRPGSHVLVSTHAVCRAAPSHAAEVVAHLVPPGLFGALGRRITPVQTVSGDAGEEWFQAPGYLRWTNAGVECWLPESVLPLSRGAEADLLHIADRLLAAPEGRPLREWVAAHNLFLDRWHRATVDASAILSLRRLELLERALAVVGRPGWWQQHTFVELDPLVHTWIETLGDRVAYAPGGRWRVSREAFAAVHEAHQGDSLAGEIVRRADRAPSSHEEESPESEETPPPTRARALATIAPDAACGREPSPDAEVRSTLPLDHHFSSDRPDTAVAGEQWTFVSRKGCWVQASLTAPGDTDEHVVRIAERFLTAPAGRSREDLLRVYNVLSGRRPGHGDALERSPVLSLRRLELLEGWLRTFSSYGADPLALAVIRTLGADVGHFEPGAQWFLRDDALLSLHERYRDHPRAHEILWKLATSTALHDCAGDLACFIEAEVLDRAAVYWLGYPEGPRVADAVARAVDRLNPELEGCRAARDAEPGSWEARWLEVAGWEERGGAEAVGKLRTTLSEVGEAAKAPLVRLLDDLEGCATGLGGLSIR